MDNWDDVVERAINAYQECECGAGFKKSFSAAGRVFVEAALEEAAKVLLEKCHDDMTRDEEAAAIRTLKGKLP